MDCPVLVCISPGAGWGGGWWRVDANSRDVSQKHPRQALHYLETSGPRARWRSGTLAWHWPRPYLPTPPPATPPSAYASTGHAPTCNPAATLNPLDRQKQES